MGAFLGSIMVQRLLFRDILKFMMTSLEIWDQKQQHEHDKLKYILRYCIGLLHQTSDVWQSLGHLARSYRPYIFIPRTPWQTHVWTHKAHIYKEELKTKVLFCEEITMRLLSVTKLYDQILARTVFNT